MTAPIPSTPQRKRKKSGVAVLVGLLVLAVAGLVAVKTGWAGFGWAEVRSRVYPRNDALLEWVPADTQAVAIVDPHKIPRRALAGGASGARAWIDRVRSDVKKAAGVDLGFDVDKIVLTPSLVVLTGRFDGADLATRLSEYKYARTEYSGRTYLVRAGEDALLCVDDEVLVYGDEAAIKASIDAKDGIKAAASLAANDEVIDRLAQMGWNEPLFGTVQLGGDRPSLRSVITGATGPRAVTFGARIERGVEVRASVDAGSVTGAEELAKRLDEKRASAADLEAAVGQDLGTRLAPIAKDASVKANPGAGQVAIDAHVPSDVLDATLREAALSPVLSERYRAFRLVQLLAPAP